MKRVIIPALILVVLCVGVFTFITITSKGADDKSESELVILDTLKVGRYYLENGTEEDYIEVFEDGTIQVNIDYIECIRSTFPGMLENATPEEYELYINAYAEDQAFWDTRHYYTLGSKTVGFSDTPNSEHTGGRVLIYEDENTLIFDEDSGYIYHYQE